MFSLVLLACVLTLAASENCRCTPDEWEGVEGALIGAVPKGHATIVEGGAKISYDAKNERVASVSEIRAGKRTFIMRVIQSDGMLYVINEKEHTCKKRKLHGGFKRACVPKTAKPLGAVTYGAGKDSLKGNAYFIKIKQGRLVDVNGFFVLTSKTCLPTGESYYGSYKRIPLMETVSFYNITLGIKNPAVFKIPAICDDEAPVELADGRLPREHRIFGF